MKLPKFWIKAGCPGSTPQGKQLHVEAWGWSRETVAEAEKMALQRARHGLERLLKGLEKRPSSEYDYLDMPLREEVVEEIGPAEQPVAAITRNRYGSLILNSASVLFADVDFPKPKARGFVDAILLLFSSERRETRAEETRQATLSATKTWISCHANVSLRLYRTAAGLRLLFTDRHYQPSSEETLRLLKELNSDALYIRLTRKQDSFRARLTPKPRRCEMNDYPFTFPFNTPEVAAKAKAWRDDYAKKTASYRVCDLVVVSGRDSADPVIKNIVELHDRYACQPRSGRLA